MADPSALPTDDDQQLAQTGASLETPMAEGDAPSEPAPAAEPGAPAVTPADQAPAPELASPAAAGPEAKPPEPGPEPTPAPLEAGPAAQPDRAGWTAAIASEPGAVLPGAATPEVVPAPEPEVLPVTPPPVPTVATTMDLPARVDSSGAGPTGEGGEWALLLSKLQAWLGSGKLQAQLQAARTPLTLVAGLIALLVVLQIYGALLAVIDHFPLAPGLLELVGLIAVVRFGRVNLVRSQDRQALIGGLQQRWKAFQGKA